MTRGKNFMRIAWVLGSGSVTAAAMLGAGCFTSPDDCANKLVNCAGSGPSSSSTSSSASSSSGSDGSGPGSCVPSESVGAVADTCGIFVSSSMGDDGAAGSQAKPLKTLGAALMKAKGAPVYACGESFTESVAITGSATLYGALDCTKGWVYDASKRTQLTTAAGMIPLTLISSASGTDVHDFAITAADATTAGRSSIAVLDDQADLVLDNVDVVAGAGKDGAPGAAQSQVMTPSTAAGGDGADNTCGSTSNGGGNPGQNMCLYMGNMTDVSGGIGGTGTNGTSGGAGGNGNPTATTTGIGGAPETTSAQCATGVQGAPGTAGMSGNGGTGIGDVDASGYHGALATGGMTSGSPGQGGGGGGGANQCASGGSGPGGGGGGAGGCGGAPGNPGQSGGSSIGILALSAKLTLTNVTINTSTGGAGGLGGDGQPGGPGGSAGHAPTNSNACDGNKGGQGGRGGSGGGGAGGHSVAVAIKGGMLPDLGTTTVTPGSAGVGSGGGDGDMTPQTKGGNGMACKTLDFSNPTPSKACVM